MKIRKPRKKDLVRAAKWATVGAFTIQATAVASVVAVDKTRQHRTPPSGRFPHMPPINVQVDDNAMRIYTYGQDLYDDMLADIRAAEKRIYFECFINQSLCNPNQRILSGFAPRSAAKTGIRQCSFTSTAK